MNNEETTPDRSKGPADERERTRKKEYKKPTKTKLGVLGSRAKSIGNNGPSDGGGQAPFYIMS